MSNKENKITDFEPGDIVHHITSESVLMIVTKILNGVVCCSWMSKKGKRRESHFVPVELKKR